jgi:hypothetical protein
VLPSISVKRKVTVPEGRTAMVRLLKPGLWRCSARLSHEA